MVDISKFKKLSDREHVLIRPGRYIGSTVPVNYDIIIDSAKRAVKVSPAFLLLFSEVISNAIDHSKTKEGKCLKHINVRVNKLQSIITVQDDGAGIPVVIHPEEQLWIPDMVLGHLKSGTNFDDSMDQLTGQNGEGASLTNIYSSNFNVYTGDGKKSFTKQYYDNMGRSDEPTIAPCTAQVHGTTITYKPDMKRLGANTLNGDHIRSIEYSVTEMAVVNPKIKFTFNGEPIEKTFIEHANDICPGIVSDETDDLTFCIGSAPEGFQTLTFINSTRVNNGGTHIEYIGNKVIQVIRELVSKKLKADVKPSSIKPLVHMFFNISMNNPRYDSQTKDQLITAASDYGFSYEVSSKFRKELAKSQLVLDIIESMKYKIKLDDLTKASTMIKPPKNIKSIEKYEPAGSKTNREDCTLILTEGDSAAKTMISARDSNLHGVFPLRGKLVNVRDMSISKIIKKNEIQSVIQILGANLKQTDLDLRYGKILIAADQDLDGFHILGLCLNMFSILLPKLVADGRLYSLRTPIMTARCKKELVEFFTQDEFDSWSGDKLTNVKYYKGLGGWDTKDFKRFLVDPKYTVQMVFDPIADEALDLVFNSKRANDRKTWLGGIA